MALLGLAMVLVTAAIDPDGQVFPGPTDPATISVDTIAAAAEANVEITHLLGAMSSTGALTARQYLIDVGELAAPSPPPPPVPTRLDRLVDCIIQRESRGNPNAVNRSSGASGLGQFLATTWKTTPQGRAGYSVFDPVANRAAVRWMLEVGRGREFVTIGGC